MKNLTNIIVSLTVAAGLVACGDNQKAPDAGVKNDAPVKMDAPPIPAAPTLGTVIDRMGRPAVNTALNALIDDNPLKTAKKDAYNHAIDPAAWTLTTLDAAGTDGTLAPKTVRGEFAKQLAILDTLDQGSTPPGHHGPRAGVAVTRRSTATPPAT
ncbi:MAG: hypothetical protein IPQ07_18720 [Myxococcales bacterium]|nr:hypothetical protein [Myxococcales bacterium]